MSFFYRIKATLPREACFADWVNMMNKEWTIAPYSQNDTVTIRVSTYNGTRQIDVTFVSPWWHLNCPYPRTRIKAFEMSSILRRARKLLDNRGTLSILTSITKWVCLIDWWLLLHFKCYLDGNGKEVIIRWLGACGCADQAYFISQE